MGEAVKDLTRRRVENRPRCHSLRVIWRSYMALRVFLLPSQKTSRHSWLGAKARFFLSVFIPRQYHRLMARDGKFLSWDEGTL